MAMYNKLPVFKQTYDLLLYIYQFSAHLSRDLRYTLGQDTKKGLIELLKLIYKANATYDKEGIISQARVLIVEIKINIRIMHDLKQMTLKQYAHTAEMTEEISKQLAAWQQYQNKQQKQQKKRDDTNHLTQTE